MDIWQWMIRKTHTKEAQRTSLLVLHKAPISNNPDSKNVKIKSMKTDKNSNDPA